MNRRREFLKQSGLLLYAMTAIASTPVMFIEGCSFGSVMAHLATYLPIALKAVAGVAAIVAPGAGTAVAAILGMVSSSFGALQGAVNDYNSAPAASKQTTLEKVLLSLDLVQEYLGQAYTALGLNPSSVMIQGAQAALTLIIATLGSIEATLAPQAPPTTASVHLAHSRTGALKSASSVTVGGMSVAVTGNLKDFKGAYNTVMQNAGRPDLKL